MKKEKSHPRRVHRGPASALRAQSTRPRTAQMHAMRARRLHVLDFPL